MFITQNFFPGLDSGLGIYIYISVFWGIISAIIVKKPYIWIIISTIILALLEFIYLFDIEIVNHSLGYAATYDLCTGLGALDIYFIIGVCIGWIIKLILYLLKKLLKKS